MEAGAIDARTQAVLDDLLPFRDYFQEFVYHQALLLKLREQHDEICDLYQAAILGEMPGYEYFLIHMPRRTAKTKLLQALATWTEGEFGDAQLMYGSYSEKLVSQTIRYISGVMERTWYKELYGDILHSASAELVTTIDGGMIYGTGISGTTAGLGAGLKGPGGGYISLDDPANPRNYMSAVQRENVIEDFETTWKGCRNSDQWCPIFINAQRIGPDDLPGYVRTTYPNKTYVLEFPLRIRLGHYKEAVPANHPEAVSAFPETWSLETLSELEKTRIGRFVAASQFQQQPVSLGGNLIPVESFGRYDPREAKGMKWGKLVITVDTALKTKEANNFSCFALWGLCEKRAYLIDLRHGKWESPELLEIAAKFYDLYRHVEGWPRPRMIIEEKAAGTPLLQNLKKRGIPAIGIERDIDKVRRVQNVLPYIETGMAMIPTMNSVPWIAKWEAEHAAFAQNMSHSHDDQCLIAGTLVECLRGSIPIEDMTTEDQVLTRKGWRRVLWAGQTGTSSDLWTVRAGGREITGTGSHLIWTEERGFCRLDTTTTDTTLMALSAGQSTHARARVSFVLAIATPRPEPVFNLTVEGEPEFFANGILVHNCDTTCDAVEFLLARKLSTWDVLVETDVAQ